MDQATSTWRSSLWAQWLGWTLLFGMVTAAGWLVYGAARMAIPFSLLAWLPYLPMVIAAFWIGPRRGRAHPSVRRPALPVLPGTGDAGSQSFRSASAADPFRVDVGHGGASGPGRTQIWR